MKRFFALFCVVVLMLTLSACGLDALSAPTNYHATFELYAVSQDNDYIDYNNLTVASQLIRDISVILKGQAVLNRVIEETGITLSVEQLEKMISVENQSDSRVFTVCVTDKDGQLAMDIANALAKIAPERVNELIGSDVLKVLQFPELTTSSPWENLFSKD